jgi:hypothetical protein
MLPPTICTKQRTVLTRGDIVKNLACQLVGHISFAGFTRLWRNVAREAVLHCALARRRITSLVHAAPLAHLRQRRIAVI